MPCQVIIPFDQLLINEHLKTQFSAVLLITTIIGVAHDLHVNKCEHGKPTLATHTHTRIKKRHFIRRVTAGCLSDDSAFLREAVT